MTKLYQATWIDPAMRYHQGMSVNRVISVLERLVTISSQVTSSVGEGQVSICNKCPLK